MKKFNSFKKCDAYCMFDNPNREEPMSFHITPVAFVKDKNKKIKNNISFLLAQNENKYLLGGYMLCFEKDQVVLMEECYYKVIRNFRSLFYNPFGWTIKNNLPYEKDNDPILFYFPNVDLLFNKTDDTEFIKFWCNNVDTTIDMRFEFVEMIEAEELGYYDKTLNDIKFSGMVIFDDGTTQQIDIKDLPCGKHL